MKHQVKETNNKSTKIHIQEHINHPAKKHNLQKFLFLVLILASYGGIIIWKFGRDQGLSITFLTRSFFVLCTPVADAGFLLDFPVRILSNFKMIYSEITVRIIAIVGNIMFFNFNIQVYDTTLITKLFKHILETPYPFRGIIILSCIGSFASIYFGDEIFDVVHHHNRKNYHKHINKYQVILFVSLIVGTFILYDFLLKKLGIVLPL